MDQLPAISPGTVSKILWHFTGGPTWNAARNRQNTAPKPANNAYENLKSILRSKHLRLGNYKELIKVVIPEVRKLESSTKTIEVVKNVPATLESAAVCCLSDIPAPHLRYHAYRYGRFAIGFHRESVIRAGFNPVFYTLDDTTIIRKIYEGLSELQLASVDMIRDSASNIDHEVTGAADDRDDLDLDVSNDVWQIEQDADSVESAIDTAKQSVETFISFVKTFNRDEFSSIYCEREWRSTNEFDFTFDDVAMVVVPRQVGRVSYFKNFVERVAPSLGMPRRLPVVPWDDLVEH